MWSIVKRVLMLAAVLAGGSVWLNAQDEDGSDRRADYLLLAALGTLVLAIALIGE